MRHSIFVFIFLCLTINVFGQGFVFNTVYRSNSLQADRLIEVYVPDGYNSRDTTKYPVIYFLSNLGDYLQLYGIVDSLISADIIDRVIVVKAGREGLHANSELNGREEDNATIDLVAYVDKTFKTDPDRNQRTIMGLSLSGTGAMTLALKHPDLYRGVASLNGTLNYALLRNLRTDVLQQNGGSAPFNYDPANGLQTRVLFEFAGAYSPNLQNPPFSVDFLFDSNGDVVNSVLEKWMLHDPAFLAVNFPADADLDVYFDSYSGFDFVHKSNTSFADSLGNLGLPYEFLPYSDEYNEDDRIALALMHLDEVMKLEPVSGVRERQSNPVAFTTLSQNYPNPFNPSTTIQFAVASPVKVNLKVFDILGREVAILVDEALKPGTYNVIFEAKNLPSGIYVYRIQAGEFVETKKLMILK